MPVVRYERQVAPAGQPNLQVNPSSPAEAFGGGQITENTFGAAQRLASTAYQYAAEEKRNTDEIQTLDAINKLKAEKNDLLMHYERGFLNRRGRNAFEGRDTTIGEFEKKRGEIMETLANDAQKQAFLRYAYNEQASVIEDVDRHVFREREKFDQETTDASLKMFYNDAINNYQYPQRLKAAMDAQLAVVMDHARRTGKSDQWLIQQTGEITSRTNAAIIERMLANGEDRSAEAFYKQNESRIIASEKAQIEKALEVGRMRGDSQRITDRLLGQYDNLNDARDAMKQMLGGDPKLRDEVDSRLQREFSLRDQQREAQSEMMFLNAYNLLQKNNSLDDIPPTMMGRLSPSQQEQLRRISKTPSAEKDNEAVYLKYRSMPYLDLAKLKESEIVSLRPKLTESSWKEIVRRRAEAKDAMKSGSKEKVEKFDGLRTERDLVDDGLVASGALKWNQVKAARSGRDNTAAEKLSTFEKAIEQRWREEYEATGKSPSMKRKQELVDEIVKQQVFVAPRFFGSPEQKSVIALSEAERNRAFVKVDEIPPRQRLQLANYLTSLGISTTTENLERAYGQMVVGGRSGLDTWIKNNRGR